VRKPSEPSASFASASIAAQLRRLDVWPVDDLGVRQGYGLAWKLDSAPTAKELAPLGERFRPYRSIVARYCWEAVPLLRPGGSAPDAR
jgi:3-methyladenine DNA glycosylase/8-oxoguanine DNA glycosylase